MSGLSDTRFDFGDLSSDALIFTNLISFRYYFHCPL